MEIEQNEEHADTFAVSFVVFSIRHYITSGAIDHVFNVTQFCQMLKAYYAYDTEQTNVEGTEPVYNEELGLAIEKLKDGYQLKHLWDVLSG